MNYSITKTLCLAFFLTATASDLRSQSNVVSPALADQGWQAAGWGGGGFFFAAAWHPTQESTIYLAGDVNGVYRTDDLGEHWRNINHGLVDYAVYSLAVDFDNPQTVYAATEGGLCKSVDGGEHWQTLPHTGKKELRITGKRKKSIRSVAVNPADGNIVYAASPAGKIYKSTDGGQSWTVSYELKMSEPEDGALRVQYGKINSAFFGGFALPVKFPMERSASKCVGLGLTLKGDGSLPKDSFLVLKTDKGVTYRSRNLNEHYRNTEWNDVVLKASDFAFDPEYAKKHPEAVYNTPDWKAVTRLDLACSGPLPTQATVSRIRRFYFAFEKQEELSSFKDFSADKTVWQTFGNIQIGPPTPGTIYSVAVSTKNPNYVIAATHDAGLVQSKDAGQSWRELSTPAKAANATFDPNDPETIYGCFFEDGIRKSTDGGKTWHNLSNGFSEGAAMIEVAVNTSNPLELYAIGYREWGGFFYHSSDGGQNWTPNSRMKVESDGSPTLDGVNSGTAALSRPTNLTLNPKNPKQIFVSANWRNCLSTDGGLTWTEKDRGADISCVTDIRFFKNKTYVTAMDEGTLVSENGGKSWKQLWPLKHTPGLSGHNWRVAITEVNGAERIISTATPWYKTPTCLIRSQDGGATFDVVTKGLPDYDITPNTMWGKGHPRAIAVDPNNPMAIYLGIDGDPAAGKSGGGIFKSSDGGATWQQLAHQPGSRRMYYGLAVDPTDSQRLYWGACAEGGGVYRSNDGGETWSSVFSNENYIWNVLVTAQGTVYCSGRQLWRSRDHGLNWEKLTDFSEKRAVVGLEVDPHHPNTIWVSTNTWDSMASGGIFKSTDGGVTWKDITWNIPCIRPQILRYNPETRELWAGNTGLYKIRQ